MNFDAENDKIAMLLNKSQSNVPDYRQKLFEYMSNEHGVTLLDSDINEIENIINPKKYPYKLYESNVDDKDLIIHGLEEGSENWKAEYDNCRALLQELVDLKIIRENLYKGNPDGKEYAERKPKAWEAAKAFLSTYQHEGW